MNDTEVLVVGAGPTGLALACGLRLHGIRARVVDQAPGPATTSRANILYGRGVEVLDRLGALGDLPERSVQPTKLATYVNGRPALTMPLPDHEGSAGKLAMYISQADIEAQLRARLSELGVTVEWDAGLTDAEQDGAGVTTVLSTGETVRAGWLVGCDGAHSAVRKRAGIGFPGTPVIEQFLLADVHLDWDRDHTVGHIFMHRDGVLMAVPMRLLGRADDLWRLMANVAPDGEAELSIVDRFPRLVAERAGVRDVEIRKADWTSVFRIHRRLADDYRRGRFLLAGDAAHIHSPVGGQGMNTGVGDAENLAWKLALVLAGRASHALLDTYQAERRPLAEDVLRSTTANTKLLVGDGVFRRLLRDRVLFPIARLPPVRRRNAEVASQLSVSYRRGPLGGGARFGGRPRPGDRIPDLPCRLPDGRSTRLHAELGGRWALLAPEHAANECAATARELLGDLVCSLYRTERSGEMWLVRPDGHLAWRGRPHAAGSLRLWLEKALR